MICSLSTCRAQDLQTLARRTKRSVGIGAGSITGGRPRALVVRTVKKPGHLGDQHDAGTEFLTLMLLQMTPLVSVKALRTNPTCRARYNFVQRGCRVARQETRTHDEKYWWVLSQDVPLSVLDIEEPWTSGHPAVNTNMENTSSRPELKFTIQVETYSLDLREEMAVVLTSRDSTEIEKHRRRGGHPTDYLVNSL